MLWPGGNIVAVVSEDDAPGVGADVEVRTFPGFALEDVDRPAAATALALDALDGADRLAVELHSLPGALVAGLRTHDLRDVRPALQAARAVKDPDELEAVRAAIEITDSGQAAARATLRSGATELEL